MSWFQKLQEDAEAALADAVSKVGKRAVLASVAPHPTLPPTSSAFAPGSSALWAQLAPPPSTPGDI